MPCLYRGNRNVMKCAALVLVFAAALRSPHAVAQTQGCKKILHQGGRFIERGVAVDGVQWLFTTVNVFAL